MKTTIINKAVIAAFTICIIFLVSSETTTANEVSGMEAYEYQGYELIGSGYSFHLAQSDNFFRRLLGRSTRRTASEPKSRSQRHNTQRPRRYSPPASNSQNPGAIGGQGSVGAAGSSSDMSAVRNTPKPPLYTSRRDQYTAFGHWELGLLLGSSHTLTDIGGSKGLGFGDFADYHTSNFGLSGGVYGRYIMNDWFALNLGMNFASLSAERDQPLQVGNNEVLRFQNEIFEFFSNTEFRLPNLARTPWDIYGFIGIGVFFSDASIYGVNDQLITTQDDYSQVQPFIPFGGGFSVKVTNTLRLGYELGWRNTIFHYLDGVKKDNTYDHYFLNSLKIGFTF